ncbi:MAG TPA: histidine phosphatase family protein [Candidatus Eisenbacteria bacterium]
MRTTRVLLVRHGATVLSAEDRFAGETDAALSEAGVEQARLLGVRLATEEIAAFVASPLSRAMETARRIAAPHGAPVAAEAALREISHGRWEGQSRAEVEALFPDEYARWERDPFTFAPEGGETGLAVTARALPALLALVASHEGRQILIVSHKATIRLLLSSLLGFDPRSYRDRLDQSPAALNVLDFRGLENARLCLFNDTSHYRPAGARLPDAPAPRLSKRWSAP